MENDLAVWAATLEIEAIEARESNVKLIEDFSGATTDLLRHLEAMNSHLAKLKHLRLNSEEFTRLEVERQTATVLEDLDIRLARATRKARQNCTDLTSIKSTLADQEDAIESLNERLIKLEKFFQKTQRTRTLIN